MSRRAAALALVALLAVPLGACGGDDDEGSSDPASGTTDETSGDDSGDDGGGETSGDVDCDGLEEALGALSSLQLLAQMRTQAQIDLLRDGTLNFDVDAFLAGIEELRVLTGFSAAPFDDVEEGLDTYAAAGEAAEAILDGPDPVPQASFDALEEITGPIEDVAGFLGYQAGIGTAFESACG